MAPSTTSTASTHPTPRHAHGKGARPPAGRPSSGTKTGRSHRAWSRWLLLLLLAVVGASVVWWIFRPGATPPASLREEFARQQTLAERNQLYAGAPRWTGAGSGPVLLRNQAYSVGYSDDRENPLWVGYRLDRITAAQHGKRPGKFSVDRRTRSLTTPNEYTKTGFDRGHLAPSFGIGSRFGPDAQLETFLMSNIVPQKPNLNRKLWKRLEELESDYANRFEQIWVFTGPVFDNRRQLLEGGVEIPDLLYKILVDEDGEKIRMLPFLVPQDVQGNEPLSKYLTTVDEIEKQTGLDFFWALSDPNEDRLEAFRPTRLW